MKLAKVNKNERFAQIRERVSYYKTNEEIEEIIDLVDQIIDLKEQKNAVILGHNYMTPEVFYGVSDFKGDSLALAKYAAETDADIILFNGVHFMAETAKILNPQKQVLIADLKAGCSLSESITAADVRELKRLHPHAPVITYINCSAEVKAESDIICTSANAVKVVNSVAAPEVIMIPDNFLSDNVQKESPKKLISWPGKCMVHELYSAADIQIARKQYPGVSVVVHPECKTEVTDRADFSGSTSQMGDYIRDSKAKSVMLLTECSMADNLRGDFPDVEFISTCQSCPHMKKITLQKIKDALLYNQFEVTVEEEIRVRAKKALDAMLNIGR